MSRPYASRNSSSSVPFVRVNGKIRAREVRVIGSDGNRTTVMKDKVVVSKTLQLHYGLPGQASARFQTGAGIQFKTP